jgi:hypothetical protein
LRQASEISAIELRHLVDFVDRDEERVAADALVVRLRQPVHRQFRLSQSLPGHGGRILMVMPY